MPASGTNRVRATIVGSLPKPSWLADPGEIITGWHHEGARLTEAQDDAVRLWIAAQEAAGPFVRPGDRHRTAGPASGTAGRFFRA